MCLYVCIFICTNKLFFVYYATKHFAYNDKHIHTHTSHTHKENEEYFIFILFIFILCHILPSKEKSKHQYNAFIEKTRLDI